MGYCAKTICFFLFCQACHTGLANGMHYFQPVEQFHSVIRASFALTVLCRRCRHASENPSSEHITEDRSVNVFLEHVDDVMFLMDGYFREDFISSHHNCTPEERGVPPAQEVHLLTHEPCTIYWEPSKQQFRLQISLRKAAQLLTLRLVPEIYSEQGEHIVQYYGSNLETSIRGMEQFPIAASIQKELKLTVAKRGQPKPTGSGSFFCYWFISGTRCFINARTIVSSQVCVPSISPTSRS